MTWDLTERASHIVEQLISAPRKRQAHLQILPALWHAFPKRTRITIPVRVTERAIHAVVACLDDSRDHVRLAATIALHRPDPFFSIAAPHVIRMLDDRFSDVQTNAARAITRYGDHRVDALPALKCALSSDSVPLQRYAARSIVDFHPTGELWTILYDAAFNDAIQFHCWLDGLVSCIRAGLETTHQLEKLKVHVLGDPKRFDPASGVPVTNLWMQEINQWPSDSDSSWLLDARDRVFAEIKRLQSGNTYVNMIGDAISQCDEAK